jgi:hypothetical protein
MAITYIDFYAENPIENKTIADSCIFENINGDGSALWTIYNSNDITITAEDTLYLNADRMWFNSSVEWTTIVSNSGMGFTTNPNSSGYSFTWNANGGIWDVDTKGGDVRFNTYNSTLATYGTMIFPPVDKLQIGGGTNGQVLTTDGSGVLSWTTVSGGGGGGMQVQVDTITSTSTWTKPVWAKYYKVYIYGGGSGGGSGARQATTVARAGGGGGAGSAMVLGEFLDTALPSSILVTIGAGGNGGASITVDSTNGNIGGNGGISSFGSLLSTYAGNGGGGGTTVEGTRGQGYNIRTPFSDGSNYSSGTYGNRYAGDSNTISNQRTLTIAGGNGGAGGGGASANSTTTANGGTIDLWSSWLPVAPSTGGTNGGAGNNGVTYIYTFFTIGTPGGGGSYKTAQATGAGGNGSYGSGGGGGAGSDNGFNSGGGGAGGNGICIIVSMG